MANMMQLPLADFYSKLEADRGLPAGYLARTRAVESSNGRNLANPKSSARGDFQFIRSTANSMGLTNPMDPYASATAAADLAAQNAKAFQRATGRTPTGPDLYGLHQQGSKGYVDLVRGQAPGGDAQALNGGAGMSASGFLAKIHGLYNGAKVDPTTLGLPANAAIPNGGAGPTVANAAAANAPMPGAQGPSMPIATAAAPAPVDPTKQAFNGGLLGLLKGDDYTGQGSGRDTMDKIGDTVKSDAFGTAAKGLAQAMAPTPQQPQQPIQINPDNANVPQLQFLSMLKRRKTGQGGLI